MGQKDELFDLRECDMSGLSADSKDIAGAILNKGNFKGTTFKETGLTKAIAYKAKFDEADFTRAVADRVNFQQASLRDAIFDSTILTGSDFNGADVTGAD